MIIATLDNANMETVDPIVANVVRPRFASSIRDTTPTPIQTSIAGFATSHGERIGRSVELPMSDAKNATNDTVAMAARIPSTTLGWSGSELMGLLSIFLVVSHAKNGREASIQNIENTVTVER